MNRGNTLIWLIPAAIAGAMLGWFAKGYSESREEAYNRLCTELRGRPGGEVACELVNRPASQTPRS